MQPQQEAPPFEKLGMRLELSKNHKSGGEFGSPHISRMEGDLTKFNALGHEDNFNLGDGNNTATDCSEAEANDTRRSSSSGEHLSPTRSPHHLEMGENAHEPRAKSWSNIVRSAGTNYDHHHDSNGPIKMSSSGETLLTANTTSQAPTTFNYLRQRSHSFPESNGDSRFDKSMLDQFASGRPFEYNYSSDRHQSNARGIPQSQPVSSSYIDAIGLQPLPTIQQGIAGPTTPLNSPMIFPNPNNPGFATREFKSPRQHNVALSNSPLSLGESNNTDQTSPMSSPSSLSPHMTPLQLPKQRNNHESMSPGPSMWQLSPGHGSLNTDANEIHSEALIPPSHPPHNNHFHSHPPPPQSINHHNHHQGPASQPYGHFHAYNANPSYQQQAGPNDHTYHSPSRQYNNGPTSPPRHVHSSPASSHPQSHPMQNSRPGSKLNSGAHQSNIPRSSTEVLKTLLRKKACLYEPETSFAISLVTWIVGRRLAMSQGYFTRQQLQSGVHSCVASKIDEGHVTRTKVNRCMQIILNSCFHYIIPRPDGSEESGEHFRSTFSHDVSHDVPNEDHLLGTLPAPWNNLHLMPMPLDDLTHSPLFYGSDDEGDHHHNSTGKAPGKESSAASIDSGGKRAVLLCFNENVRSAADVFRCHNEFIRDVAHSANLNLSPDGWRSFFTGTKIYRKRSGINDNTQMADMHDHLDQQDLSKFRTSWCAKRYEHDQSLCVFAHVDVNRGWLRRDPFAHNYKPIMCPHIKPIQDGDDCYFNMCPLGVECNHAHSKEEILYHPENYKQQQCRSHFASCPLRDICPNMHTNRQSGSSHEMSPQSHGNYRHGKRYSSEHSPIQRGLNPASKKRHSATTGHASGFAKHPGGSPMLYIGPAPISEFEKTLLLPGLQAMFRDHSSSILSSSSLLEKSYCEYGIFGYKFCQQRVEDETKPAPIGRLTGCTN